MDAASAVLWYIVTALVILPAWKVSRRLFPDDSQPQCAMHAIVLLWTWIVVVSCSLGTVGCLNAVMLGCGALSVAWCTWAWVRTRFTEDCVDNQARQSNPNSQWPSQLRDITWSSIGSAGIVLVSFYGLQEFPHNWDTLMYHRPLMVHWLHSGSLYVPQGAPWFVPGNNELLGLWWAAPFSGDFWVGLMNVPAVLLLALGTFELGRAVGLTGLLNHTAAIATVGSAAVVAEIANAKNDVSAAALFVAGASYGIRYLTTERRRDLIFSGIAWGLLCGIKYYGVGYAAMGCLAASIMMWWTLGSRRTLLASLLLAVTVMAPSSYWYGRNLAASGTPIYPIGSSSAQRPEGQSDVSVWRSTLIGNGRIGVWPQYLEAVYKKGGLCQATGLLLLPVSLGWLFGSAALFAKPGGLPTSGARRLGLGLMIVGTFVVFGVTPFTVNVSDEPELASPFLLVRFSLIPLSLLTISWGVLFDDARSWLQSREGWTSLRLVVVVLLTGSFAGLAIWSLGQSIYATAKGDCWLVFLLAADGALLLQVYCWICNGKARVTGVMRRVARASMLAGGMILFVMSTVSLSAWWHANFADYYNRLFGTTAFIELEKWDSSDLTVAAICNRYYPFFGSRRQFHVYRPAHVESEDSFLSFLNTADIGAVAVMHAGPSQFELSRYARANVWVGHHKSIFHPVATGSTFSLYRVDRKALKDYSRLSRPETTGQNQSTASRFRG